MPIETILAVAVFVFAILGALVSAGGAVIGFIRGIKKIILGWIADPVNLLKKKTEDNLYRVEEAEKNIRVLRGDMVYLRDEALESRREAQEVRRMLNAHIDNEERHVK